MTTRLSPFLEQGDGCGAAVADCPWYSPPTPALGESEIAIAIQIASDPGRPVPERVQAIVELDPVARSGRDFSELRDLLVASGIEDLSLAAHCLVNCQID